MRRHLPGSFWVPFCGKKVQNTRDIVAAFSVLLMAKVPKPSACRFSREQPPARVERAQQEQDYAASRSGHAGCRLFFLRCKRECGGLKPASAGDGRILREHANIGEHPLFACSCVRPVKNRGLHCNWQLRAAGLASQARPVRSF